MGQFVPSVTGLGSITGYNANHEVVSRFQLAYSKADSIYNTAIAALEYLKSEVESLPFREAATTIEQFGLNVSVLLTEPAPVAPVITYEDFNMTLDYTESAYTSSLLDTIKTSLLADLNGGGTGLSANVEADMWIREAERDALLNQDTKDQITAEWAERGLPLPDGILAGNLSKVDIEYQNKKLDKSRAISEETRKLAIQNLQFSKDTSIKLEAIALTHFGSVANRALDVYKTKVTAFISEYEMNLKEISTRVEVYKAQADVFVAEVQAAGTLAQTEINLFNARIAQAYNTAMIASKNVELNIEELKAANALKINAIQGVTQVASQMVASLYAGVSASAHIQAGESASTSLSFDNNLSESHSYEETPA